MYFKMVSLRDAFSSFRYFTSFLEDLYWLLRNSTDFSTYAISVLICFVSTKHWLEGPGWQLIQTRVNILWRIREVDLGITHIRFDNTKLDYLGGGGGGGGGGGRSYRVRRAWAKNRTPRYPMSYREGIWQWCSNCPLLKLTERLCLSTQNDPRKQCFNT